MFVFMVMKEHVSLCDGVAHYWGFHSFWTTIELCGTEEFDTPGFGYTLL